MSKAAKAPFLECFELPDTTSDAANVGKPSVEWQNGYAAGVTEGHLTAMANQEKLSADIAQAIADMGFGFAEARVQILQSLKPLFGALISRVLPALSQEILAAHVVAVLQQAAEQDSDKPLELLVNPTQSAGLSELLPYAVGMPVVLVLDAKVPSGQAILRSHQKETCLDAAAISAGVRKALEAIFEDTEERANYG